VFDDTHVNGFKFEEYSMKKKLTKASLLTAVLFLIVGCGAGSQNLSQRSGSAESSGLPASAGLESMPAESSDATALKGKSSEQDQLAFPRKIIYTGDLRLVCEDLDVATEKLESRIKEFGAYISNASKNGSRGSTRESTWTIRIPAEKFDPFIKFAVSIGELQSNNRQAQDVSEEFYDVAARLKNKKIEEQRLVELLKNATGKLSEVLTVEKELSRVREETERIEGRLRFLTNQTDLSTITVTIQEIKNFQPEGPPNVMTQVSRSFNGSIEAMKGVGLGILLFVVAILPWAIPFGLTAWLIVRKLNPKKKPTPPPVDGEV
jgi:hypothetical protein